MKAVEMVKLAEPKVLEIIELELRKRGVHAKTKEFKMDFEADPGERVHFESEWFTTVPAIFKCVKIYSFSAELAEVSVKRIVEDEIQTAKELQFSVDIDYEWISFKGGHNGSHGYTISGTILPSGDNSVSVQTTVM